jgi:hypothetical protein
MGLMETYLMQKEQGVLLQMFNFGQKLNFLKKVQVNTQVLESVNRFHLFKYSMTLH